MVLFFWDHPKITQLFLINSMSSLTPEAPIPQNGQTQSNNSSANCRQIVWVCLTNLWNWRYNKALKIFTTALHQKKAPKKFWNIPLFWDFKICSSIFQSISHVSQSWIFRRSWMKINSKVIMSLSRRLKTQIKSKNK